MIWYHWMACGAGAFMLGMSIVQNWVDIVTNKVSFLVGIIRSIVAMVLGMFLFVEPIAAYVLAGTLSWDILKLWGKPAFRVYPIVQRIFLTLLIIAIVGGLLVR